MRLLQAEVRNFGSYRFLEFNFSNLGLCLIHGPTGSGKSTLQDVATWVLYGVTSKGGAVDEVKSWLSDNELTVGAVDVELPNGTILVTRIRGKAQENDLYWREDNFGPAIRGKDIKETQELLENRLGVKYELYSTGAVFNEFSPSATFFTASSKQKREIFEEIANLKFAAVISEACTKSKKDVKEQLVFLRGESRNFEGRLLQLAQSINSLNYSSEAWKKDQQKLIESLEEKSTNFDKNKESRRQACLAKSEAFEEKRLRDIDEIDSKIEKLFSTIQDQKSFQTRLEDIKEKILAVEKDRCPRCYNPVNRDQKEKYIEQYQGLLSKQKDNNKDLEKLEEYEKAIENLKNLENSYIEQVDTIEAEENTVYKRLREEKLKADPFFKELGKMYGNLEAVELECKLLDTKIKELENKLSSLEHLYDLSFNLRGELLNKSIKEIEASTNRYLEKYFDSEIKVTFDLKVADNLKVSIQKNSYDCVYSQLSKGQRAMLKLCFVISIMKHAANRAGIHFSNLFMDEALDGLDSNLKVKAFSLFEELAQEHESIMLIDHALEFQNLFENKFEVSINNDVSEIIRHE